MPKVTFHHLNTYNGQALVCKSERRTIFTRTIFTRTIIK